MQKHRFIGRPAIFCLFVAFTLVPAAPLRAEDNASPSFCAHHHQDVIRRTAFNLFEIGDYSSLVEYLNQVFEISPIDSEVHVPEYEQYFANAYSTCELVGTAGRLTKFSIDQICAGKFDCIFVSLHTFNVDGEEALFALQAFLKLSEVIAASGYSERDINFANGE